MYQNDEHCLRIQKRATREKLGKNRAVSPVSQWPEFFSVFLVVNASPVKLSTYEPATLYANQLTGCHSAFSGRVISKSVSNKKHQKLIQSARYLSCCFPR